jgi:hypothetical protein
VYEEEYGVVLKALCSELPAGKTHEELSAT